MTQDTTYLISLIEKCREENEIGQRIEILESINCLLSKDVKLIIPSLITNSCIDNLLSALEVRLLPPVYTHL